MFAQGIGAVARQVAGILAAFLRVTLPELLVLGGFGVGVWAAFAYSTLAGRVALAVTLILLGIASSGRKQ